MSPELTRRGPMLEKNVAEGIHRVEDTYTNYFLVEEDDGICIVDACVARA